METKLSEEQELLKETVHQFALEVVAPIAKEAN